MPSNGKKGRGALGNAAQSGQTATQSGQNMVNQGQQIANSEINTNGGLSPLVSKQLASEQGNIGKTYANATQGAERGLSMRGMGVAPSGLSASIKNTGINNAGQAETGAVGNAFGTQNQLNNTALSQPINALNATNNSIGATTGAATALNKAGSTMGDVMSGLSGLAGIGANIGTMGGAGGVKALL